MLGPRLPQVPEFGTCLAMPDLDQLLNARGHQAELGAYVTAACFNTAGSHAGFALGDGGIHTSDTTNWNRVVAHSGAVLSLAPHPVTGGFLSGGDDGRLLATSLTGETSEIAKFGSKWVDHVAGFGGKTPLLAAAVGKNIHLFTGTGAKLREMPHPSSVTGIAFDTKGKRIAASHYNGASLWFTASATGTPRVLEWKGSHLGVAIHPNGDALVTSMQENSLHGWTLPEGKHMRMAGYPAKTESIGFTKSGRWLATGGADSVVFWPFFGGGPMGKAPTELGAGDGIVKRIACHPDHEIVAAGFDTGLLMIIDIPKEKVLPVCGPGRGAISALNWNSSGSHLAFGTEGGFAAVVDFSAG
jgi:WD40 repeat protein